MRRGTTYFIDTFKQPERTVSDYVSNRYVHFNSSKHRLHFLDGANSKEGVDSIWIGLVGG